jgi:transposase
MKLHGNARTCLHTRLLAVRRVLEEGWTLAAAAEAAGLSVRTISKWLRRYRDEGEQGLLDRPSAPARAPRRTPEERVEALGLPQRVVMGARSARG